MITGVILVFIFIIGFAFGIAMPFILKKMNIYNQNDLKVNDLTKNEESKNNANEIIDEWLNGKKGD
jgi:hypothetical protein